MNRSLLLISLSLLLSTTKSYPSSAGDLDLSFDVDGIVTIPIGADSIAKDVAVQADDKIVVAGYAYNGSNYDIAIARLNSNGQMDETFGVSGVVQTPIGTGNDYGEALAVQSNGKIIVAGWARTSSNDDFVILRYNTNGSLDASFGAGGKVYTAVGSGSIDRARGVELQDDGKIVVAGNSGNDFAVVRYLINGDLDSTFSADGKVITDVAGGVDTANSLALQDDGKIVVVGTARNGGNDDIAVVRYHPNGSLDSSFNLSGKLLTDIGTVIGGNDTAEGIGIQPDGKLVVIGSSFNGAKDDLTIVRYLESGMLDSSFNGSGKATASLSSGDDIGFDILIQDDGRIVTTGTSRSNNSSSNFATLRYLENGALDASFGGTGKVITSSGDLSDAAYACALQYDGRILVAGESKQSNFAILRYEAYIDTDGDGIADEFETNTGVFVSATDTGSNPNVADSDEDGLSDGVEVRKYQSNPNKKDSDNDGFNDGFEIDTGFSPTDPNSTPDATFTIRTAVEFRFNAAPGQSYRIESSPDATDWNTIESDIIGQGDEITRFYSTEGQSKQFYRVQKN